jgi:hypothetical protein
VLATLSVPAKVLLTGAEAGPLAVRLGLCRPSMMTA